MVLRDLRRVRDLECGEGATEEQILRAERTLSLKFPESYRRFIRTYGWASFGSYEVFGLGKDIPKHLDLLTITLWERNESGNPLPLWLLPIYNDGGGNLVCIDCREGQSQGTVIAWYHDELSEGPDQIGRSFDDWLYHAIKEST